jgi:hypothetical protein
MLAFRSEIGDTTAIYVVPDENFDDWVVRDESGHELGHYPGRLPSWLPDLWRGTAGASLSFASLRAHNPRKIHNAVSRPEALPN